MEKIVRRYLRAFVTGDRAELAPAPTSRVVTMWSVRCGLRCTDVEVHELSTAGDRIVVR